MKIVAFFCSLSLLSCAQETESQKKLTDVDSPVISEKVIQEVKNEETIAKEIPSTDQESSQRVIQTTKKIDALTPAKEEPTLVSEKQEELEEVVSSEEVPEPTIVANDFSGVYSQILSSYVTADGRVNYKGLMMKKDWLDQAITHCKRNAPTSSWSKNKTMAYWINAYNLFTLKLITDNYPVKSILDLSNGKPWDDKFIEIGGKKLSLNDIENNILRKDFSDPRIHFAINCASISCPKLLNKPYTEANLNSLLDAQAKRYLMDSKQNYISNDKLEIAEIFNWFKDDFKVVGGVPTFIKKQTGKDISDKATITYKKYNWNLNE